MTITRDTLRNADLNGKAIKWAAPSYRYDSVYSGVCILHDIFPDDEHPIHSTPIYGDSLDRAFWGADGNLAYNDHTRTVELELIED